jgi:hypothetical protein
MLFIPFIIMTLKAQGQAQPNHLKALVVLSD